MDLAKGTCREAFLERSRISRCAKVPFSLVVTRLPNWGIREEGGRARERERTGAGSPRIRHVEAGAGPSRTVTVVGSVDYPGVGMGHPKCLCRAIDRTVCTCRIVIGRMPSSESRLKRYLMTTFRKTMDDSLEALGKRGLAREGIKTTNPAVATGDDNGEGGSRREWF